MARRFVAMISIEGGVPPFTIPLISSLKVIDLLIYPLFGMEDYE